MTPEQASRLYELRNAWQAATEREQSHSAAHAGDQSCWQEDRDLSLATAHAWDAYLALVAEVNR